MGHLLKVLLQKLVAAVAEDVTETLVDPQPGAARADWRCRQQRSRTYREAGLAFAQRVLGFLALGDVEVEAHPRGGAPAHRAPAGQAEMVCPDAVHAHDAVLPAPLGARAHAPAPGVSVSQVFRGEPVQPSPWSHLVERLADQVEEGLAHELHATVGAAHPHP